MGVTDFSRDDISKEGIEGRDVVRWYYERFRVCRHCKNSDDLME